LNKLKQATAVFDLNSIINTPPFSLAKQEKDKFQADILYDLTKHHYANCAQYQKILNVLGFDPTIEQNIENIPPIPARLFKDYDLLSVKKSQIIKTMTSSGTTGQNVSKIFLDRTTSTNQTKVLIKIVSSFTGAKRLPMLIIDTKSVIKNRNLFSARGAGILGFSMLGYDITYALDDDMQLDFDTVDAFCRKHKDKNILIFGFTFMIWEYFYKKLEKSRKQLALENGIMIHGGGWKKMREEAVDNKTFKRLLKSVCEINRIYNYYGMVEQTGSIFMECEAGYLHSSIFSDVTVLQTDFTACGMRETGLVQLSSLLPYSYPGHIILTEDTGEIIGEDDCSCGRLGKYFKIHGRVLDAEIRGCGDTYESI
jgi:phenylacetate-coenzyme A ligase PaaK-like adenylate-forming protein